jgi:ribosomal protein S18 acetylase RimI-like enzyme
MRSAPVKDPDIRRHVLVRKGLFSDEDFISQLSGKVFGIYGPYREMTLRWFDLDTTTTFLAVMERIPVGFIMLGKMKNNFDLPSVAEILAIAVDPARQRKGIGQMLLHEVEKEAAILGEKRLCLHTATNNIAAQKLFIKNGYHLYEMKRNFYPKGQNALMMIKEIGKTG